MHGKADRTHRLPRARLLREAVERFAEESKLILATRPTSRHRPIENGVEYPRITVTLATGIPKAKCEAINLAYRDVNSMTLNVGNRMKTPSSWKRPTVLYRLKDK